MTIHGSNWLTVPVGIRAASSAKTSRQSGVWDRVGPAFGAGTAIGLDDQARKLGCHVRRSTSLLIREDQSLKGVIVVMANPGRMSAAALLGRHYHPGRLLAAGDRVLAEVVPGDTAGLVSACGGVPLPRMFRSAGCYGIGHPQILGMMANLRREARAKANGDPKQEAIAALHAYVESAENIRARGAHVRNRVMEHHRPDRTTFLLLDEALAPDLAWWAMNPLNRLDAVVVSAA